MPITRRPGPAPTSRGGAAESRRPPSPRAVGSAAGAAQLRQRPACIVAHPVLLVMQEALDLGPRCGGAQTPERRERVAAGVVVGEQLAQDGDRGLAQALVAGGGGRPRAGPRAPPGGARGGGRRVAGSRTRAATVSKCSGPAVKPIALPSASRSSAASAGASASACSSAGTAAVRPARTVSARAMVSLTVGLETRGSHSISTAICAV